MTRRSGRDLTTKALDYLGFRSTLVCVGLPKDGKFTVDSNQSSTLTLPSSTSAKARFASARVPTDDPTIREDCTTSWFESTVSLLLISR
jgi:hypothetical protein